MKKILKQDTLYQVQVDHLLRALEPFDDTVLNMAAIDGGWSAIQTMHHLILTEELALQYVRKKLSFNPELKKSGWDARWRTFALWFYLSLPIRYKAPAAVNEEHLPGFTTLADTRKRWTKIREDWSGFLKDLDPGLIDKAVFRHPLIGRLSWAGMLKFFQYHLNRHRKQIERTLGV